MALVEQGWSALLVLPGESAPFVMLGFLLAGLVRKFVPAAALNTSLGGSGMAPNMHPFGLGPILPKGNL